WRGGLYGRILRIGRRCRCGGGVFYGASDGAVIDDFAADGGEAADAIEGIAAEEDATAGGAGDFGFWVSDFCGRIEHEEEKEEWGDEEFFGEGFGAQEDHQGGE